MFLSIMGMYEYDDSLFNGLQIPAGINKEALINNICLQCGELEIMYPDLNTMKLAITVWSIAQQKTWEKLYKTMVVDYNPIWNVDANITETDTGTDTNNITRQGKDNRKITSKDSRTDNETVDLTDTKSVKGFNSTNWSEAEKVAKSGTDNRSISGNSTVNDDLSTNETETGTLQKENVRTTRRTGNIGVTTTQQMLEQERAIAEFSIIDYITLSFKERFCLLVY